MSVSSIYAIFSKIKSLPTASLFLNILLINSAICRISRKGIFGKRMWSRKFSLNLHSEYDLLLLLTDA